MADFETKYNRDSKVIEVYYPYEDKWLRLTDEVHEVLQMRGPDLLKLKDEMDRPQKQDNFSWPPLSEDEEELDYN